MNENARELIRMTTDMVSQSKPNGPLTTAQRQGMVPRLFTFQNGEDFDIPQNNVSQSSADVVVVLRGKFIAVTNKGQSIEMEMFGQRSPTIIAFASRDESFEVTCTSEVGEFVWLSYPKDLNGVDEYEEVD
jgi:hypothetical protein